MLVLHKPACMPCLTAVHDGRRVLLSAVELTDYSKELRYFCQACPYVYKIDKKITKAAKLLRKQVDDVLGGDEAWKNVAKTDGEERG